VLLHDRVAVGVLGRAGERGLAQVLDLDAVRDTAPHRLDLLALARPAEVARMGERRVRNVERVLERRMERALIAEFEERIEKALPKLNAQNIDQLRKDVTLYLGIRGYGPVKEEAVRDVHRQLAMRPWALAADND